RYNLKLSWLKIGMVHPLPEERIKKFLEKVDKVLVLEELDPLIEAEVMRIAYPLNKRVEILGKFEKTLSLIGNYSFKKIKNALEVLLKTKLVRQGQLNFSSFCLESTLPKRNYYRNP
ncbi:unnamed protein product, partial [marine sediment metagenome]